MHNIIRILWIEEETATALAERKGYFKASLDFTIEIVETRMAGEERFRHMDKYDIVIIDIRIPKDDNDLIDQKQSYISAHYNKHGIDLIKELFDLKEMHKMLIYTNESYTEIEDILIKYNVKKNQFLQKNTCRSNEMLEEIILNIFEDSKR